MTQNINLLNLPDLALHHICTFLTDPFDLLHFGNTSRRLRTISLEASLWWPIIFNWFDGTWTLVNISSRQKHPRDFVLELFRSVSKPITNTESNCMFAEENWVRVDSPRLRCILGWLQVLYPNRTTANPDIEYEKYLYNIGFYHREISQECFDYTTQDNFEFSDDRIHLLSELDQAADKDLRGKKQPFKDESWYMKPKGTSPINWKTQLFPAAVASSTTCCHGDVSKYPLRMLKNVTVKKSSWRDLIISLSIVLAKLLEIKNNYLHLRPSNVFEFIDIFCWTFTGEILDQTQKSEEPTLSQVLSSINKNSSNTEILNYLLEKFKISLSCGDIITEFTRFISQYEEIDFMVDKVKDRFRKSLYDEIDSFFFANSGHQAIKLVDLTDSDLNVVGNFRHEMAAVAYISEERAIVTWHCIWRMPFLY